MRITANRTTLLNAIKTAMRALGNLKDLPELSSLLFEADANTGIITITGTDTHTQIQCRLRNEHILEGGSMLIKPIVADMLKLLPGETVEIGIGFSNELEIKGGQCRYGVPFLESKKFPRMQIPFPEDFICVKGINSIIKRTIFATDPKVQEIHKHSLQFVKLSFANGQTTAEATNGQIAALSQTPHGSDGKLDLILHEKAISILASIVSPNDELYVGVNGNYAVFMKEDMFFSSQLYRGDYIEGSKLVNYIKPMYKATMDARALYDLAGNVATIFNTGDDTCINLCIADNKVAMKTQTAMGASQAEIPATETVPTAPDGFNYQAKWLLDCLRQTSGPLNLSLDPRGFMLIEANQSKYCVGPRGPVRIKQPEEKKEKKPRAKATKTKTAVPAAA